MDLPLSLNYRRFIKKHLIQAKALDTDKAVRDIHRIYELIDTKSSALLTHVSIMIAICAFFVGRKDATTDRILYAETLGYISVALVLLFCLGLSMYKAPQDPKRLRLHYAKSCHFRSTAYVMSLYATRFITVLVLVTVLCRML